MSPRVRLLRGTGMVCLSGLLLATAACQRTVASNLPTGPAAYAELRDNTPPPPQTYLLRTGDKIRISVLREEDFSVEAVVVDNAGNVSLPFVGEVPAVGHTQSQLAETVRERLGARFIRDPMVTVSMLEMAKLTISVEGEVEYAGVYEVTPGQTLLTAVALARSPTDTAKLDEIFIFRKIAGERYGARFDLARIRAGLDDDPDIIPGDVVVVGFSRARQFWLDALKAAPLFNVFTRY